MSDVRTSAEPRGRHRTRLVIAGALSVLLIGSVVIGTVLAVGSARSQGYLGGPPVVPEQYRALVTKAAARCHAVPARVLAAQISAESKWDPQARSGAGAQGIAQFMPEVWRQYGIDGDGDGRADVWNPADAIQSAAELNCLNRRLVRSASGNRLQNTIAAYNAGYAAVLRYDGVPPFPETQAYVRRILDTAKSIVL